MVPSFEYIRIKSFHVIPTLPARATCLTHLRLLQFSRPNIKRRLEIIKILTKIVILSLFH